MKGAAGVSGGRGVSRGVSRGGGVGVGGSGRERREVITQRSLAQLFNRTVSPNRIEPGSTCLKTMIK